jgi:hypothetical protein
MLSVSWRCFLALCFLAFVDASAPLDIEGQLRYEPFKALLLLLRLCKLWAMQQAMVKHMQWLQLLQQYIYCC